jgi:hypothetical protein
MSVFEDHPQWFRYIETPRRMKAPVKLDKILSARMKAFLATKENR